LKPQHAGVRVLELDPMLLGRLLDSSAGGVALLGGDHAQAAVGGFVFQGVNSGA
jgi:hypothetical protein